MLEITFTDDFGFAEDGISTTHFKAGETHLVSTSCADSALQVGAARVGSAQKIVVDDPPQPLVTPAKQPKSKLAKQPK